MQLPADAPIIGVPMCVKHLDSHNFHTVGEKYLTALIEAAGAYPSPSRRSAKRSHRQLCATISMPCCSPAAHPMSQCVTMTEHLTGPTAPRIPGAMRSPCR